MSGCVEELVKDHPVLSCSCEKCLASDNRKFEFMIYAVFVLCLIGIRWLMT